MANHECNQKVNTPPVKHKFTPPWPATSQRTNVCLGMENEIISPLHHKPWYHPWHIEDAQYMSIKWMLLAHLKPQNKWLISFNKEQWGFFILLGQKVWEIVILFISGHLGLLKYVSIFLSYFKYAFDFLLWNKMRHTLTVCRWSVITDKVTMLLKMVQVVKAPFRSSLSVFPISRAQRKKAP